MIQIIRRTYYLPQPSLGSKPRQIIWRCDLFKSQAFVHRDKTPSPKQKLVTIADWNHPFYCPRLKEMTKQNILSPNKVPSYRGVRDQFSLTTFGPTPKQKESI